MRRLPSPLGTKWWITPDGVHYRAKESRSPDDINGRHHLPPKRDIAERFWEKVEIVGEDNCWEWISNLHRQGYGFFKIDSFSVLAHRVAYCLSNNLDVLGLDENVKILHSCDNPRCCNPRHLSPGTQHDNILDMMAKGRGGQHKTRGRKLSEEARQKMRIARARQRPPTIVHRERLASVQAQEAGPQPARFSK